MDLHETIFEVLDNGQQQRFLLSLKPNKKRIVRQSTQIFAFLRQAVLAHFKILREAI